MTAENQEPEKTAVCPICGHRIPRQLLQTHTVAEDYVLEGIRKEHPNWIKEDGACPKCWEDYQALGDQIRSSESKQIRK